MVLPTLDEIRAAQKLIYRFMPPTPQYSWPLLNRRLGTEAWLKHENHTPVGAFKIRGALVYLQEALGRQPNLRGVIAATRGNFGQGVALAARLFGIPCTIAVPHGNSLEKNEAMRAQGAELVEHGSDFQESLEHARHMADERGLFFVESFHPLLVLGTATYALELFEASPALDRIYVPVGLGSSICGVAAARNALNLATEIIGVVAADSPSYSRSFQARQVVEAPARTEIADGLACRVPNSNAVTVIVEQVARVIEVEDSAIKAAMRACYGDTHNVAEGAGAAALAGALQEKEQLTGMRIGIVLTGGNVDRRVFAAVLNAN